MLSLLIGASTYQTRLTRSTISPGRAVLGLHSLFKVGMSLLLTAVQSATFTERQACRALALGKQRRVPVLLSKALCGDTEEKACAQVPPMRAMPTAGPRVL